eukprot:11293566-Prorocentrum_lima.AAC.1
MLTEFEGLRAIGRDIVLWAKRHRIHTPAEAARWLNENTTVSPEYGRTATSTQDHKNSGF